MVEVSPAPINPEELKKRKLTVKIKQEYFSALKHEGMLVFCYLCWRVIVIPNLGSVVVKTSQKLKEKWMDGWISKKKEGRERSVWRNQEFF